MNALQSYSSDEESDQENKRRKERQSDHGTNYDDVGMDISEDSSDDEETNTTSVDQRKNGTEGPQISQPQNAEPNSQSSECKDHLDKPKTERSGSYEKEKTGENSSDDRDLRETSRHSRSSRDSRDHRDSRETKDSKDYRSSRDRDRDRRDRERDHLHSRDNDRRRHEGRRRNRRSRSRSRERRYTRSRSRSRSRERRRQRSRSRSRDRDRRKPHEIRKEAQQKIAAYKAENPNFDQTELLKQSMQAQVAELSKQTGIALPSYYNPATMNPLKIAEQERKKKLLWGNKTKTETSTSLLQQQAAAAAAAAAAASAAAMCSSDGHKSSIWANTTFDNDSDGKMAEKFKRLMGVKESASSVDSGSLACGTSGSTGPSAGKPDLIKNQETLFSSMERQYEMARLATHTHKGFGLGFSSQQPFVPKQ